MGNGQDRSGNWWLRLIARRWFLLVAGSLAALILFSALAGEVLEPGSNVVDQAVRAWVLAHQVPAAVRAGRFVTNVGSPLGTIIIAGIAALLLWQMAGRSVAALVVTAPAVASGVFSVLKLVFRRVRPDGALLLHMTTFSFPSGHATVSAAVWMTLTWALWRERLLPGRLALLLGIGWPLAIGLSRLYLDVHWATDVVGGWCLGAAIAAMAVGVLERSAVHAGPVMTQPVSARMTSP